jgi:tetratricopeptide (TPR) repeat protein
LTASVLNSLAGATYELGDPGEAARLTQQSLVRAQADRDVVSEMITMNNLATFEEVLGQNDQARQHAETVLAMARKWGARYAIGLGLDRLGEIALETGDIETAARCFTESLTYFESLGIPQMTEHVNANLLLVQGEQARLRGDRQVALRLYQEASKVLERPGDKSLPSHIGQALSGRPTDYAYLRVLRTHLAEVSQ